MDGLRKNRSHPSVMSLGRYVCPGERPRLNQGLSRHHRIQVEGFEGPMRKVPQVMTREGGVPAPRTRLQHLGDSEVLLEQKRWSDTPDLPGSWRRIRNGSPRELVCQRYHLPEPEGYRVLRNLICATSWGDEQPLTSRTMCSSEVQVTPDRPHRT